MSKRSSYSPRRIRQESLWIPVGPSHDVLHLRRIWRDPKGPPVFMLHGSIENGKIFYSNSGKGFAPYLAAQGFDVYIGDLRGRGASRPPINRRSSYGQTEEITEDIPAFVRKIRQLRGNVRQHWVGHSWGGVLLASCYVRFPKIRSMVRSMTCFGTKRRVQVWNVEKLLIIDLFWNAVAPLLIRLYGYLPIKELRLGMDNETALSHLHCALWVRPDSDWVDPGDGFDYGRAARRAKFPPTLHLAGIADKCAGNPRDVEAFIRETVPDSVAYQILSRHAGNLRDYGHNDLLTYPKASRDHFPWIASWLREVPIRPK